MTNEEQTQILIDIKDFNAVKYCGEKNRTCFRYKDRLFIGCFSGSYDSAIERINKKYSVDKARDYISNITHLRDTNIYSFKGVSHNEDVSDAWRAVRLAMAFELSNMGFNNKALDYFSMQFMRTASGKADSIVEVFLIAIGVMEETIGKIKRGESLNTEYIRFRYLHSDYGYSMEEKEKRDLQMTKDTMYQKRGFLPLNRSAQALGYEPDSEGEECSWCGWTWLALVIAFFIWIFY